MKILVTGGTGLLGSTISKALLNKGFEVRIVTRGKSKQENSISYFHWDIDKGIIDENALRGIDGIINLAGATIAKKWTSAYRKILVSSRVDSSRFLLEKLKENQQKIKVFIGTSASGFYIPNQDILHQETDPSASNFLGELCVEWEKVQSQFEVVSARTVIHRLGIILDKQQGALPKMIQPIRGSISVQFGKGNQYIPWVHVNDVSNQYIYSLDHELNGIYNACAGNIEQKQLNLAIQQAIGKKSTIPISLPKAFFKMTQGEMYRILYDSIAMSNQKIKDHGFRYSFDNIDQCLDSLLTT